MIIHSRHDGGLVVGFGVRVCDDGGDDGREVDGFGVDAFARMFTVASWVNDFGVGTFAEMAAVAGWVVVLALAADVSVFVWLVAEVAAGTAYVD